MPTATHHLNSTNARRASNTVAAGSSPAVGCASKHCTVNEPRGCRHGVVQTAWSGPTLAVEANSETRPCVSGAAGSFHCRDSSEATPQAACMRARQGCATCPGVSEYWYPNPARDTTHIQFTSVRWPLRRANSGPSLGLKEDATARTTADPSRDQREALACRVETAVSIAIGDGPVGPTRLPSARGELALCCEENQAHAHTHTTTLG